MTVWGLGGPEGFTMSGDAGVFTLLDVGLGLQADRDSPTVCFIVKRDLKG